MQREGTNELSINFDKNNYTDFAALLEKNADVFSNVTWY